MTAGVPAPFDPDIAAKVCEAAAQGMPLTRASKSVGYSRFTIWRWRQSNPLFDQQLMRALEEGIHSMIDETIEIADTEPNPHTARNKISSRQWAAERRLRKDYGASVDVNLTERVDIGGALIEARKRIVLPGSNLEQITDAQVIDVSPHNTTWTTDKETAGHVSVVNPFD